MNPFQDVREFHDKFGVPALSKPTIPSVARLRLRAKLITEEYCELMHALGFPVHVDPAQLEIYPAVPDMPEVADGIADLAYVAIGTAHELGIPLGHVWNAVHESNMRKQGGGQDAKGKIQKPAGWVAPDIEGVLKAHGWEP